MKWILFTKKTNDGGREGRRCGSRIRRLMKRSEISPITDAKEDIPIAQVVTTCVFISGARSATADQWMKIRVVVLRFRP